MADQTIEVLIKGTDQLSDPLSRMNDKLDESKESINLFDKALDFVGFTLANLAATGIENLIGTISNLAGEMISSNAQFEQYTTQFNVLLGSTEAAQERMAQLAEFGRTTPFDLPGVVEADRILQGFGLHAEDVAKKFGFSGDEIRRIAGDVAAGTGASFQEMAMLIGRFSSGATGEALMRMAELGIGTREQLTKMGIEFSKSGELLSPLPEAMEAVLTLMNEKYGGMMEAQSKTFEGMMSNLRDWVGQTLRTIGQPIFEILKDKLADLLDYLSTPAVQEAVTNLGEALGEMAGAAADFLLPAIENLLPVITETITQFANWLSSADPLGELFESLPEPIQNAIDFFMEVGDTINTVKEDIDTFLDGLKSRFGDEFERIGEALHRFGRIFSEKLVPAIQDFVGVITDKLAPKVNVELPDMFDILDGILSALPGIIDDAGSAIGRLSNWLEQNKNWIDKVILSVQSFIQWFGETKAKVIDVATAVQEWIVPRLNALQATLAIVWQYIDDHILPVFRAVLNVLDSVSNLGFKVLMGIIDNVVMPALRAVWNYLDKNILPIFRQLAEIIDATVGTKFRSFKINILDPINTSFRSLGRILDNITKALNDFASGLDQVGNNLPDWLTPGSPTPFEMGLRGISDAMRSLSTMQIPSFGNALSAVGAGAGGAMSQTTNNQNYNLTINSNARSEQVAADYNVMRALSRRST